MEQNRQLIKKRILSFVEEQEQIGDQSSGSGHMAFISVEIDDNFVIKPRENSEFAYAIDFTYTKTIDTEFTYYPDNPPQIYVYSQRCYCDNKYQITGFEKPKLISSNFDLSLFGTNEENVD